MAETAAGLLIDALHDDWGRGRYLRTAGRRDQRHHGEALRTRADRVRFIQVLSSGRSRRLTCCSSLAGVRGSRDPELQLPVARAPAPGRTAGAHSSSESKAHPAQRGP